MILVLHALAGAFAAILINYLSDVLPISRRLSRPICLNCGKLFSLKEYLFSFKCAKCQNRTSLRVILVTVFAIVACILLYYFPFGRLGFITTLPVLVFLGVILVIDIEYRVVLIQTSLFGLFLFLVYGWLINGILKTLAGGLAGFLIMLALYYLGVLFNKIMGRIRGEEIEEVALGFGDVYVCAFLGLLTGWPAVIAAILLAILASGAYSLLYILIMLIARKYRSFSAIPYTPFLIVATVTIFYIFKNSIGILR